MKLEEIQAVSLEELLENLAEVDTQLAVVEEIQAEAFQALAFVPEEGNRCQKVAVLASEDNLGKTAVDLGKAVADQDKAAADLGKVVDLDKAVADQDKAVDQLQMELLQDIDSHTGLAACFK